MSKYKLKVVGAGHYEANNILALAYYVITHRFFHLFRGDGWVD